MTELVTLKEVSDALRLDLFGTPPDFTADPRTPDIAAKIAQAQDIVLDFIQPQPDPAWDAETVPKRVVSAIIITVGCLLDDSEHAQEMLAGLAGAEPSPRNPIVALLWRLRQPSLA